MGGAGNRQTSFFVYLVANSVGGTTVFPEVWRPNALEWCSSLKCKDDSGEEVYHVEIEPKVGTAIFWYNLDPSGNVDTKTLHAGTAVVNGTKVGLNIWTRERKFRE
jgi:prolyl 4-hydroxylase